MNLNILILAAFLGVALQFAVASPIDNIAPEVSSHAMPEQFRSCAANYLYLDTCADTITDDRDWWNVTCFVRCLRFNSTCRNFESEWQHAVSAVDVQSDAWACRLYENTNCQGDFVAFQGKIRAFNGDWNDRALSYQCGPRKEMFGGTSGIGVPLHPSSISINADTGVMTYGHELQAQDVQTPHFIDYDPPAHLAKRQNGMASFGQGCPEDQLNLRMCGFDWNPSSNNWSDPTHCGIWCHAYQTTCINLDRTPRWHRDITAVNLQARDGWACRIHEENDCSGSWLAFTGAVPSLNDYFWKNQAGSVECGPVPYIYNWVNETSRSVPEAESKKTNLLPGSAMTAVGPLERRDSVHLLEKRCALPDIRCSNDQVVIILCNRHEQGPDGCDKCFGTCAAHDFKCQPVPADLNDKVSYYWSSGYIVLFQHDNCKGDVHVTECCKQKTEVDLDTIGMGGKVSSFLVAGTPLNCLNAYCINNAVRVDRVAGEPQYTTGEAKALEVKALETKALVPLEKR